MHLCESKHVRCICIPKPCYENISSYTKLLKINVFMKCLSYRVLLGHISMLLGEYSSEAPVLCMPLYNLHTLSSAAGQTHGEVTDLKLCGIG